MLLAADLESRKEVAIKVIRANDIMYKAAQQETVILQVPLLDTTHLISDADRI